MKSPDDKNGRKAMPMKDDHRSFVKQLNQKFNAKDNKPINKIFRKAGRKS